MEVKDHKEHIFCLAHGKDGQIEKIQARSLMVLCCLCKEGGFKNCRWEKVKA